MKILPLKSMLLNFHCLIFCQQIVVVELLNVSLSGKRFNIRPIAVGLSSLNVIAVRHFAMDFLSQTFLLLIFFKYDFCRLTFNRQTFFFEFLAVVYFALKQKLLQLIFFFHRIIHRLNLSSRFFLLCSFYFLDILLRRFLHKHLSLTFFVSLIVVCRCAGETVFVGSSTVRLSATELSAIRLLLSNFLLSEFLSPQFQVVFVGRTFE